MNRLLLFLLFVSPSIQAQNWTALEDFPGAERDDGVSFKIGGTTYCGTGRDASFAYHSDFFAFDTGAESWTPIAPMPPGNQRQYAAGFTDGEYGFVFGGTNGNYFNDLWRYHPSEDSWQEMESLPSAGRSGCAVFVLGETAYLVGGRNDNTDALSEVWTYNMQDDAWTQLNDMPFGGRWRSSATAHNQLGYLLFGWDGETNFRAECFVYDPETDGWLMVSEFPGPGRTHVAMAAIGDYLFVFGGVDDNQIAHNDLWRFSPVSLTWEEQSPLPTAGRRGGMSFAENGVFYYTTGITGENERLKETWKCAMTTSTEEFSFKEEVILFPNPVSTVLSIQMPGVAPELWSLSVFDVQGVRVLQSSFPASGGKLPVHRLKPGMYFLEILNGETRWVKRFVKSNQKGN